MLSALVQAGPRCHSHGITGYGLWEPGGVCFIGIAPGEDEYIHTKRPLTGPSGQLLDASLGACGWHRHRTYATNALCWWNNDPTLEDYLDCWPRLRDELALLRPKLIIPLGESVTDFLLGNIAGHVDFRPSDWGNYAKTHYDQWPEGEEYWGYSERRGRTSWCTALNAYVLPTPHPAAVLRGNPYFISDIARDLSKISLVINEFQPDGHEADYTYSVVESSTEGQSLLDNLSNLSRNTAGVSLDIETNYGGENIDVFTEDLLCLSVTWDWNSTAVIPGPIAKQLDWSKVATSVKWIGQNFPFDSNGMQRWCSNEHGVTNLPIHEDTMFESYALDERPGKHGLETLGGEFCAAPFWKRKLDRYVFTRKEPSPKTGRLVNKKYKEVPLEVLYKYNAGDTTYTYRAHVRQRPMVSADGMDRVYTELLIPAANAFKDIQYRGGYIDQRRQSELMVEWCQMWLDQEEELQRIAHEEDPTLGDHNLNFGSAPQMLRFLYDVLGLPVQYTKAAKGQPARPTTNKEALEVLTKFHPFCGKLHDWRQVKHMMEVSEGITQRIKFDGMLHAQPQIHGTETGRLSYHDPNLQNIAQPWMVGANLARIREIFAPKNPDTHCIAEFDYRQIELWMAAQWSNDPQLWEDLRSGDFHTQTAMSVHNKTREQVTKGDRFWVKAVTFGKLYDRSAEDLLRGKSSLPFTLAEAIDWCRKWEQRYAGYMEWSRQKKLEAQNQGIILSPWGRKRRYYLVLGEEAHHQLRSAVNFCMQSTAHDYTLRALILLQQQLAQYDSYILIETHDAIMLEINKKYFTEVSQLVTQLMESVRPNSDWPYLQVEGKAGPNWGLCRDACKSCHRFYPETEFFYDPDYNNDPSPYCISCERQLQKVAA